MRLRLIFVAQDFPPHVGGLQTYAVRVAEQLAKHSERFVVVAPKVDGWQAVDATLDFEVVRVGKTNDLLPIASAGTITRLALTGGYDAAFHTQWQTTPVSGWLRRAGALRRLVVAAHGRELLTGPSRFRGAFDRLRSASLRRADLVLPVSANTGQILERTVGVDPQRIIVVNNGTDPHQRYPVDATAWRRQHQFTDVPIIASLGRLVPNKGFDRVIEALPAVLSRVPAAVYVVAGKGPDESRLRHLACAVGVADRVHFIGRVNDDDLNAFYSAADIFATISREDPPAIEGFGIVFLEAGACETPVVAGRSGGISDAVLDRETGIVVDPHQPAEVASAIVELLEDPALARRMGQQARRRVVESLNWSVIGSRIAELVAEQVE